MSKALRLLAGIILVIASLTFGTGKASAGCPDGLTITPQPPLPGNGSATFTFDTKQMTPDWSSKTYRIKFYLPKDASNYELYRFGDRAGLKPDANGIIRLTSVNCESFTCDLPRPDRKIEVYEDVSRLDPPRLCEYNYRVAAAPQEEEYCSVTVTPPCPTVNDTITATYSNHYQATVNLFYDAPSVVDGHLGKLGPGESRTYTLTNYGQGSYEAFIRDGLVGSPLCKSTFQVTPDGGENCQPQKLGDLCEFVQSVEEKSNCTRCLTQQGGMWTAIGCIPTSFNGLLTKILGTGMGIAGGIAFLLILFGGLQIMTSAGNPERLNAGRELVTAAITGLLIIIFSILILRIIGYDILRIPGWEV